MAEDKKATSRRNFLKLAGTGMPAVAVALASGATVAEAEEAPSALGLQKTAHVECYLETARF